MKTDKTPTTKPTTVDEADALAYEKLILQIQNLDLQKQLVQHALQQLDVSLLTKYSIGEGDQIDLSARSIKRAGKGE